MSDDTKFTGEIVFADGTKCMLEDKIIKESDYDPKDNPHTIKVKAKKDCTKCNSN